MSYFKRFFGHLKTVIAHKWWVFHYASLLGYPWLGFKHDMSKLSPEEFFESVRFWTGTRSPILTAKETEGVSYAWLHHKGRNKHHYEYWIDNVNGKMTYHKIPFEYVIEMVCDWLSASRTYTGNPDDLFLREYKWWTKNEKTLKMFYGTKNLIHKLLWNLLEAKRAKGCDDTDALLTVREMLPHWKNIYDRGDYKYFYDETN